MIPRTLAWWRHQWHFTTRSTLRRVTFGLCLVVAQVQATTVSLPIRHALQSVLVTGQEAPDFTGPTTAGDMLTLRTYRGRPVVLNFWATWCAPCRQELPVLQAVYEAHREKGLIVLTINQDDDGQQEVVRAYLTSQGFTFPALRDPQGDVATRYQVVVLPSTMFIDATGTLTATHIGPLTRSQIEKYLAVLTASQG